MLSGASQIFGVLNHAEMPRAEVALNGGEKVTLTPSVFSLVRTSPIRADREKSTLPTSRGIAPSRGRSATICSSA